MTTKSVDVNATPESTHSIRISPCKKGNDSPSGMKPKAYGPFPINIDNVSFAEGFLSQLFAVTMKLFIVRCLALTLMVSLSTMLKRRWNFSSKNDDMVFTIS